MKKYSNDIIDGCYRVNLDSSLRATTLTKSILWPPKYSIVHIPNVNREKKKELIRDIFKISY